VREPPPPARCRALGAATVVTADPRSNACVRSFKDILQQGWSLLNNVEVENAVKFATKHDPDSKAWRPT
jgi:hypothetical protein